MCECDHCIESVGKTVVRKIEMLFGVDVNIPGFRPFRLTVIKNREKGIKKER